MSSILLICCTIMFVASLIFLFSTKLLAQRFSNNSKSSPYSIAPAISDDNTPRYKILKNGKDIFVDKNLKSYHVYTNIHSALVDMNMYEKIEGYRITKL